MRMYEVKITLLADVAEEDLDEAKRLSHHAEGIFEEYPFLRNMSVNVDVLRNPDNTICGDAYKVEQLEKNAGARKQFERGTLWISFKPLVRRL